MPRKAPVTVFEHRLTLGNYERDQLKQIVNAKDLNLSRGRQLTGPTRRR